MQETSAKLSNGQPSEVVDALRNFRGGRAAYLGSLLAWQCRVGGASAGAILKMVAADHVDVLASEPGVSPGAAVPPWIAYAAQVVPRCVQSGRTLVSGLPSVEAGGPDSDAGVMVVVPLTGAQTRGAAAFVLGAGGAEEHAAARERLELSVAAIDLYELRHSLESREHDFERLRQAVETASSVDRHERFGAAAMAFVNEVASRWGAQRVSLGFVRGRYVVVEALNGTEKIARTMSLVQDIEAAMEECADQDVELVWPSGPEADVILRETAELAERHGPVAICSLPLRHKDDVVGVVTVERELARAFSSEDVASLRLVCELCTERLRLKREADEWIGAQVARRARRVLGVVLGPRHTLAKAAAVAALAGAVAVTTLTGPDRVAGGFVVRAVGRHSVPSPFDGYLKSVKVHPGDRVVAGQTVLATLDTTDVRLDLAAAEAEKASKLKEADASRSAGKIAEAQIAEAAAEGIDARMDLLKHQLERAEVRAPIDGVVLAGDIEKLVGAPLRTGDLLFEIAPADSFGARIAVPEDRIIDVAPGQTGMLAAAAYPGEKLRFVIERVEKVAQVVENKNVFQVDARIEEVPAWLRAGMEGEARITVGRGSYAALWTRGLSNWIRMRLWL